jgi:hypothetical protein
VSCRRPRWPARSGRKNRRPTPATPGASLVGELRALLSADPLAERPRALLMRALHAAGRQAEALEVHHQARELLAGRLGVDPSAQLEQVYLRILRGEEGVPAVATGAARPSDQTHDAERSVVPAPGTTPPPVVSSPLTSFFGRDTEVSQVLKNLGSTRLVTLTGPGGVGKTRLAAEVSGRLVGGAWFVELVPVTELAEVAYAVLDTLGIRERVISRRAGAPGAGPSPSARRRRSARSGPAGRPPGRGPVPSAARAGGRS